MSTHETVDVIVVGAGPAGSTTAALLADHGRRVVVVEKEQFPRYKIGESLLPYCYFTLERLGMIEKLNQSAFIKKYSVQFVSLSGKVSQPFYFFQHFDHPAAQTWQVVRSEFDRMLVDNAIEKGADVRFATQAKQLLFDGDRIVGVETLDKAGNSRTIHAPMTVDASGRDAFAVNRTDWCVPDQTLRKIAVWTYYKSAMRDEGLDEGATTVAYLPEKGSFWYIPLPDDMVSVGIVADRDYLYRDGKDPEAIFQREVKINPWIVNHLASGRQAGPYRVTGDYSYRSRYCAADGLVMVGDAFAFLDPVFSSGVFLALKSGELAADIIHAALEDGDVSAARFTDYGKQFCDGIEAMRQLVYAFYDTAFSFGKVLKKYPHLRGDMTDCLIGNLYRDFKPLFEAVGEFASIPAPLSHGSPRPSSATSLQSAPIE